MDRLSFTTFNIPRTELRCGFFSPKFLMQEKNILEKKHPSKIGLMYISIHMEGARLGGIDECLAILRLGSGRWLNHIKKDELVQKYISLKQESLKAKYQNKWDLLIKLSRELIYTKKDLNDLWIDTHHNLKIKTLFDGAYIHSGHVLMSIEGPLNEFAYLETILLGILSRATRITTNTHHCVKAAKGKPVFFFSDHYDRWETQYSDGFSALRAGAAGVSTAALGNLKEFKCLPTIPHALIAAFDGNTLKATEAYEKNYPKEDLVAMVSFDNDSIKTSLDVCNGFKKKDKKVWGIHLNTGEYQVDEAVKYIKGAVKPSGVCSPLVEAVRESLNQNGFNTVKIIATGGFNPNKIKEFEFLDSPIDAYGVGAYMTTGKFDFISTIAAIDGEIIERKKKYRLDRELLSISWHEID